MRSVAEHQIQADPSAETPVEGRIAVRGTAGAHTAAVAEPSQVGVELPGIPAEELLRPGIRELLGHAEGHIGADIDMRAGELEPAAGD